MGRAGKEGRRRKGVRGADCLHSSKEAAEQLVEAVRKVVKMPVWQRMLVGQEGQRQYLQQAEAWRGMMRALASRVGA